MRCTYHRYCHAQAVTVALTSSGVRHTLCADHLATRLRQAPSTPTDDTFANLGVIYLLCFERLYGNHCRHYLGWTQDLGARIQAHRTGNGSRLMTAVATAGIGFEVVTTWRGTRADERRLKKGKHLDRRCPRCRPRSKAEALVKRVGRRRYGQGYQVPAECGHRKPNKGCRRCLGK